MRTHIALLLALDNAMEVYHAV